MTTEDAATLKAHMTTWLESDEADDLDLDGSQAKIQVIPVDDKFGVGFALDYEETAEEGGFDFVLTQDISKAAFLRRVAAIQRSWG